MFLKLAFKKKQPMANYSPQSVYINGKRKT